MSAHHHGTTAAPLGGSQADTRRRFALVGSPNSGKTTLFNALTGLRAKTGNYPGVTVSRYQGTARIGQESVIIEDLPGTYSLDPISPDEAIVAQALETGSSDGETPPDAALVLLDATTLRRSLNLLAQVLQVELPTAVVLTFGDELQRRGGALDVAALERALGLRVIPVVAGGAGLATLRAALAEVDSWPEVPLPPPTDPTQLRGWVGSVLETAGYVGPQPDRRTGRIDDVLLHPVAGTLIFLAVMFAVFQAIFSLAAPAQEAIESAFGALGGMVTERVSHPLLADFLGTAVLGGVGGVLVFLPQIALLFLLISLLEASGYLSRAAIVTDRLMAKAGLEGRAFVALLSSLACAIPGIMATRTLPSARDRLATMLSAPLMTCSARLPVYLLLIGLLIPSEARVGVGPLTVGVQGLVLFALYVGGAVSAMTVAWLVSRLTGRHEPVLPFVMEMPPYRAPSARSVALAVWDAVFVFLRKVTTIILATTVLLWALLALPARGDEELAAAGVDTGDPAAVATYQIDHSLAAGIGRAVEPVFDPLGFDWRINVGVIASLSAREVFVATLGQVAAAEDPEEPTQALAAMTVADGPRAGQPLFTGPTIAALLVFFMYALQCMSTVAVLRRESGSWRWPAIAFGSYFALAWVMAFLARTVVAALS
ncbi:MAG: ferrous iron transporter B [Austwickia sp.]|nr:ferrous iron transporter B [Austwickia sp.]